MYLQIKSQCLTLALLLFSLCAFAGSPEVYFSPEGGCTDAVVRELSEAKKEILVQAYSFTSTPIAKALIEAQKRGVKCRVILDKSQRTEKYSEADFLIHEGIETWIDFIPKIAHNKIIIIDRKTVITGSFNFTKAAEKWNAENLLVIDNKRLAKDYAENWQKRLELSMPYSGKDQP